MCVRVCVRTQPDGCVCACALSPMGICTLLDKSACIAEEIRISLVSLIFTCRFKSACLAAMKFIFSYFVNFYSVLYQNGLREQPFHQKEHGKPAQISRVLKVGLIDREPGSSILRRTCVTRFHRKTVRSVHSMSTCILKFMGPPYFMNFLRIAKQCKQI